MTFLAPALVAKRERIPVPQPMVPQHMLEENVPDYNSDFCLLSNDDKEEKLKKQHAPCPQLSVALCCQLGGGAGGESPHDKEAQGGYEAVEQKPAVGAEHGVQSLYKHQCKMEKWRTAEREEAAGVDFSLMREAKDLSGKDGNLVLRQ